MRLLYLQKMYVITAPSGVCVCVCVCVWFADVGPRARGLGVCAAVEYTSRRLTKNVQEKWATKTRSLISEYLQPNFEGRLFMRLVETILTRDKNWVQWKAENCLSFEKLPVPEEEVETSMEQALDASRPTRAYPHLMGAPALARLWKQANKNPGLPGLKQKERCVPLTYFFVLFFSRRGCLWVLQFTKAQFARYISM